MCDKIKEIKAKIEEIKNLCNNSNEYIFSTQLENLSNREDNDLEEIIKKYKYIFVGDNPGDEEKDKKEYFVNSSGTNLKNFIKGYLNLNETEYLFLNKTLYSTQSTKYIEKDKGDKTQKEIAELILLLLEYNKNLFVCLLGVEFFYISENGIFEIFYKCLLQENSYKKYKSRIGLYYHPSRRQLLTKAEQQIVEKIKCDKIEFFRKYGTLHFDARWKNDVFEETKKYFQEKNN